MSNFHWLFLGDVSVGIKCDARVVSDEEEDIDFDIIHNANDTFTVKYAPPAAGRYTIKVLFAGEVCNLHFTGCYFRSLFICSPTHTTCHVLAECGSVQVAPFTPTHMYLV